MIGQDTSRQYFNGMPCQECTLSFEAEWRLSAMWQWILEMGPLRTSSAINFQKDLYSRSAVKVTAFKQSSIQLTIISQGFIRKTPSDFISLSCVCPTAASWDGCMIQPHVKAFYRWANKRWPVSKQTCRRLITEDSQLLGNFSEDLKGWTEDWFDLCGTRWKVLLGLLIP